MKTLPSTLKMYQVDAFTGTLFSGNPAAICPLDEWLPDQYMQHIARENNLSETAFFIPSDEGFKLRWFTPTVEIDLCGHATLATAHVIYHHLGYDQELIRFQTLSGELTVGRNGSGYVMDFPCDTLQKQESPEALVLGLGLQPQETWRGKDDYLVLLKNEKELLSITPDFRSMRRLEARGVIITAPGEHCDFVSRFFAPQSGVNEDPVTGSAHTSLTPYWAKKLGKSELSALQLSQRRGTIFCTLKGDRVLLRGQAVTYMQAELDLSSVQNL